ncbi:DUF397 domain-containing protein [Streptomyces pactum]|uniref:DUF397 domain-containing protein n=1 Tax=Streptomyces pactum TaxID=68249 RepID=A0ABS0NKK0_9ACTN|nr:DUF397 domain-containing protein [Streptomyces pactum]MBH5335686.1 DUF397 domain-containing protein [Streptomyces pactum]
MDELTWRKSSYSEAGGNDCVELAASGTGIHLRESDDPGSILTTTPGTLRTLVRNAKRGRFDRLTARCR